MFQSQLFISIFKYLDIFGTRNYFYTERKPKLYTALGGFLSLLSLIICATLFFIISIDDIKRLNPITTTSSIPSEGYRKIKFGQEKIWIPWRIVDYENSFVNASSLFYPIIYYYSGERKKKSGGLNMKQKFLGFELCNETSMKDMDKNIFQINVPLEEMFCIDMEDLTMGGSWISDFLDYVEFDLYLCKNGIDYNETNPNCTTYQQLIDFFSSNKSNNISNSFKVEFYYPVVQFQPTNFHNPVIILYQRYYYHISRFTNKIERLYLQEHVLSDDLGWFTRTIKNTSFWGFSKLNGDNYANGNGGVKDLINEGSTSRVYSFNIYLSPGIIHYNRSYKKILNILGQGMPIIYVVFIAFKNLVKIFKNAQTNKKMIELLFENLQVNNHSGGGNYTKKKNIKLNCGKMFDFSLDKSQAKSEKKNSIFSIDVKKIRNIYNKIKNNNDNENENSKEIISQDNNGYPPSFGNCNINNVNKQFKRSIKSINFNSNKSFFYNK